MTDPQKPAHSRPTAAPQKASPKAWFVVIGIMLASIVMGTFQFQGLTGQAVGNAQGGCGAGGVDMGDSPDKAKAKGAFTSTKASALSQEPTMIRAQETVAQKGKVCGENLPTNPSYTISFCLKSGYIGGHNNSSTLAILQWGDSPSQNFPLLILKGHSHNFLKVGYTVSAAAPRAFLGDATHATVMALHQWYQVTVSVAPYNPLNNTGFRLKVYKNQTLAFSREGSTTPPPPTGKLYCGSPHWHAAPAVLKNIQYLSGAALPSDFHPCSYTPPPPTDTPFRVLKGQDLTATNYKAAVDKNNWKECRDQCNQESQCKAFTFDTQTSKCWLKSEHGANMVKSIAISGIKCVGDSCGTLPSPTKTTPSTCPFSNPYPYGLGTYCCKTMPTNRKYITHIAGRPAEYDFDNCPNNEYTPCPSGDCGRTHAASSQGNTTCPASSPYPYGLGTYCCAQIPHNRKYITHLPNHQPEYDYDNCAQGAVACTGSDCGRTHQTTGFRRLVGKDLTGTNYQNDPKNSWEECRDQCNQDAECRAFTFDTQTKICWLKNAHGNSVSKAICVSGIKCLGNDCGKL